MRPLAARERPGAPRSGAPTPGTTTSVTPTSFPTTSGAGTEVMPPSTACRGPRWLERIGQPLWHSGCMDWSPGYREVAPSPGLRDALSCLWVGVTPPGPAQTTLVLPDGAVDLVWQQGARGFLAGPDTGPTPSSS